MAEDPKIVEFNRDVRPILSENCFFCHGQDPETRKADLRLDTKEGLLGTISANQPNRSELLDRIFHDDPDEIMPPPDSTRSLSKSQKEILKKWIQQGAVWEAHWSFVPPRRSEVKDKHPIDFFIERKLKVNGLNFSAEASPEKLIRRLTLDLTGVPPTLLEIDSFLAAWKVDHDTAYKAVVDRLIDSPRYGETMATPWLDAARFADTDGYQYDGPRHQWRWRDWVIEAYNRNMPFDQFTIEQLAGDLLPEPTLDQMIATGFNRNHRYNSESGLVVEEFLLENAVDRVDTTTTLWMGLTMGCARCHDHKYDPISQKDYYQLIAFFNSVPEAGRAIKNGNSEPTILAPTRKQQIELTAKQAAFRQAKAALKPGQTTQSGGLLIDRKIAHHYPLKTLPDKNATAKGNPNFRDGALMLDGKSTVLIGEQAKNVSLRANQRFTFAFWIRPDSRKDSVVLSRQKGGSTRPGVELAFVDEGRLQFDLISRWVAGVGRTRTVKPLTAGQWTHVAISNDGSQSANGQLIYLDGQRADVETDYNTNSNVGGVTTKEPLRIGSGLRPGSANFAGALRDLRIYQTELWPEEIEILAAEHGGPRRVAFSKVKMTPQYAKYVDAREELERFQRTLPDLMVMKDASPPKPTHIRKRGVYNAYGDIVQRDVPASLPPMDESLPRNRLGFAQWLVSPEHPLTARVAVNRYWQKYFGIGLVKTSEDFGAQGEPPSHPELLDWLATEFVRTGWDIAAMQKLIVTSRTYRQDTRITPKLLQQDPNNRLLARGARFRLSGQAIRDQALFVSGLLVERIGGPSVSPYQPANMWAEMSMGMKYKQSSGEDLFRRSLYTIWKRTIAPPTMAIFDSADREACRVNRKETNTPLQALTLLNETGFVESARHLAIKVLNHERNDRLDFAFRLVTARQPKEHERKVLDKALNEYRELFTSRPDEAKKLIAMDTLTFKEIPPVEIAAWSMLCNVLLNLDEVITKE